MIQLKKDFITHTNEDESYIIPFGEQKFNGIVKMNSTGAFIVGMLKNKTTEEAIIQEMLKTYDVSEAMARKDVEKVISALRSIGAVEED
ncbi:MAG: PqqD family protein [Solobacterium sp.]|nr:PqqD family protein [Solobacterium sp.]